MEKKFFKSAAVICFVAVMAVLSVMGIGAADTKFTDVDPNAWYAESVAYCVEEGIVNGITDTTFAPNGNLTRAQFVTLLAKIDGADLSEYSMTYSGFTDVKTSQWFHNAITWAAKKGYASGMGQGKFSPDSNVTRQQLARFFYVYTQYKGYKVEERADLSAYKDEGKIASWAYEQVQWAVARGLISGMTADTIGPEGNATRAQAARIIMLYKSLDRVWDPNAPIYTPDNGSSVEREEAVRLVGEFIKANGEAKYNATTNELEAYSYTIQNNNGWDKDILNFYYDGDDYISITHMTFDYNDALDREFTYVDYTTSYDDWYYVSYEDDRTANMIDFHMSGRDFDQLELTVGDESIPVSVEEAYMRVVDLYGDFEQLVNSYLDGVQISDLYYEK